MTRDEKAAFNRRIVQSNATGIIVVLYDMMLLDLKRGIEILEKDKADYKAANEELRHATQVLEHLKDALNFKYEISPNLFSLYDFCQRQISQTMYKATTEGAREAEKILSSLGESFRKVAEADKSAPVMQNTESVVAGMTYGRNDINEAMENYDRNRGFTV